MSKHHFTSGKSTELMSSLQDNNSSSVNICVPHKTRGFSVGQDKKMMLLLRWVSVCQTVNNDAKIKLEK